MPNQSLLLIAVKICFVVLILFLLPQLVQSKRKSNAQRRKRLVNTKFNIIRKDCESLRCRMYIQEENMNCVSACMNQDCHDTVFAGIPLEMGEIDEKRDDIFEQCVKKHLNLEEFESRNQKNR